jgi:drug/metabolite transporter (DMT)-like permease
VALALSLTGLSFMVELWHGVTLDGLGVTFALTSAVIFAVYVLLAEHEVRYRDPVSWHLPVWALILWAVVLGSIVPFTLFVGAQTAR